MTGRRHSGAAVVENNLYVFGGNQESSNASILNSLEYADISDYVISTEDEDIITPIAFHLNQNYPNPFNSNTAISYNLSEDTHVNITIYDMLGRKIKNLISKNEVTGNHSTQWNGDDSMGNHVGTGIYFYQLQARDFVQTKKMVLMK